MKPPPLDEDTGQYQGMTLPSDKRSLCAVACSAATSDLRQALYVVAGTDVALLLLPLALLTAAAPSDEGCGWTPQALDVHCAVALALLWLSLVITAAQLVAISAAGPLRRALFVYRLWWHLPAALIGTAIGGALGVHALSGYLALVRGDCGSGSTGILLTSVGLGILVVAVYVYISRVEARAVEGVHVQVSRQDETHSLLNGHPEHPKGAELKEDQQADVLPAVISVVPTSEAKSAQEVGVGSLSISAIGMENAGDNGRTDAAFQVNTERDWQMPTMGTQGGVGSTGISAGPTHSSEGSSSNRNTAAADAAAGGSASDDNTAHPSAPQGDGTADAGAGRHGRRTGKEKRNSWSGEKRNSQSGNQISQHSMGNSDRSSSSRADPKHKVPQLVLTMPGNHPQAAPTPEAPTSTALHQPVVTSWGSAKRSDHGSSQRRRSDNFSHHETRRRKSADKAAAAHKRTSWCVGTDFTMPVVSLVVPPTEPSSGHKTIAPQNTFCTLTPNRFEEDKKTSSVEGHFENTFNERRRSMMKMEEQEETSGTDSPLDSPGSSRKGKRESQLKFCEPDVTEFSVKSAMRRCSRRPASPTFDAIVFNSGQNPINFEHLMEREDSDMEDESDSEIESDNEEASASRPSKEVWKSKSQPKVEVPFWLMERLQSRGHMPQEESEETPTDSPKSAEGEKKKKIKTRPSTPDNDPKSKPNRRPSNQDAESEKKGGGQKGSKEPTAKKGVDQSKLNPSPVIMPSNTFWKIPMPTRKNTMMIQVPSTNGGGQKQKLELFQEVEEEGAADENGEVVSDEDMMSSDSQASNAHPLDSGSDFEEGIDSGEGSNGDDDDDEDSMEVTVHGAPALNSEESGRRVSFSDQQLGIALPKYSEDKNRHRLGAITEDDDDPEMEDNPVIRPLGTPMQNLTAPKSSKKGNRRPSVLGIFSDDSAKQDGLYMLPKHQDNTTEVVEVRRSSLVMSTAMLNDILKQKVSKQGESDRLNDISEECEDCSQQVVLPFFTPSQKGGRTMCQCKTDPVTGFVIHTCMTPSTTQATNTGAMASYLCSEWGSRRHSTAASRSSKSRRNSGDFVDGEEDDVPTQLVPPPPKPSLAPNRKRIRNASMLAVVGGQGPVAAKKTETDDPETQDNELAISVKNIQAAAAAQDAIPDGEVNFNKGGASKGNMDELASKEQRVEADLGHKFELVEPFVLANMLKDPEVREQLLTVDVRGRDWVGGHIPSSINLRTSEVVENPFQLLVQCRRNRVHHIIFTCMYSVLRARKCAVAVEKAQEQEKQAGNSPYRLRISLLAGGMHAWINHFMKTQHDTPPKQYIDGFEPDMWSDGGPSQGGLVHVMDALWSSGGQKALSDALSQELEALLAVRRSSQQSSRRESSASAASPPDIRRGSSASASETPITPEMAAEQLMQARPRRGSGAEGHGQSVVAVSSLLPGMLLPTPSRDNHQDLESNADSDMT